MRDWNVVVSVREHGYRQALALLEAFGTVERTEFFNILALRVSDVDAFLEELRQRLEAEPGYCPQLGHVMPVHARFVFQSAAEFENRAQLAVMPWVPRLAGKSFHVRMRRRGFKGRLSSQREEQFLDAFLLTHLQAAGTPGRISFDDPDAIVAVETIAQQAGLALWSREALQRYPFLNLD